LAALSALRQSFSAAGRQPVDNGQAKGQEGDQNKA
jgi:hypothetical protein